VRSLAVPVEQLERLDELLRAGVKQSGGVILAEQARDELGWTEAQAAEILRGLGFAPAKKHSADEPIAWRRRPVHETKPEARKVVVPHSPFAALAALKNQPAPVRRPRRRRKPKAVRA
jgi:ATP-dependent RNA helicase SUPV3L1/SUV3